MEMKIDTSSTRKYFPHVNQCIYCGRADVALTQEHIIPFGLGGKWVLPKASCSKCQKTINTFEHALLRGYFYPPRVHLNFPSQHKDPRPDAFPVRFPDGSTALVPLADHPCILHLQKFVEEPKILTGTTPNGKIECGMWAYVFQPDLHHRTAQFSGKPVEPVAQMRFGDFLRLLAKIGHAYAIAELGAGAFKPMAIELIMGSDHLPDRIVGGMRDTLQPKPDFHDIWLASHQSKHGTFLIANVQLFARLQGPIYRVVVGQFPEGSPGLGRQSRVDSP